MNKKLIEACFWAAKEFKEAAQGFAADFEENGIEHLEEALMYVEEITRIRKQEGDEHAPPT